MTYWNSTCEEERRQGAAERIEQIVWQYSRMTDALLAKRREFALPVFNETPDELFQMLTEADWHLFEGDFAAAEHMAPSIKYTPQPFAEERAEAMRRAMNPGRVPTNPATYAAKGQVL